MTGPDVTPNTASGEELLVEQHPEVYENETLGSEVENSPAPAEPVDAGGTVQENPAPPAQETPQQPIEEPAPADVTNFPEDDNPAANAGDEVPPTPEETAAADEVVPGE